MTPLAQSVLTTLVFFDAQDLPLTLVEIQNYLGQAGTLREIEAAIGSELPEKISFRQGFYYLTGREVLVDLRRQKYRTSLRRFRRARRLLRGLRYVPYVRSVAISGSQALLAAKPKSDIDLFIIAAPRRIWLCRLLVSMYFHLLGARRHGDVIANRFCLNHYICHGQAIGVDKNLYTAVEYASLLPVLGGAEFRDFAARNRWIHVFLPRAQVERRGLFGQRPLSWWQKVFEAAFDFTVGPFLERLSGIYQKRRIRREEYILVSDEELSFHPGSRGQKVLARFRQNLDRAAI